MKKIIIASLLIIMVLFIGYSKVLHHQNRNILEQLIRPPVSVTWHGSMEDGVMSFRANVQVFTMNNRTDTHAALSSTHHLAISAIDNRIVTRVDFDDPHYGSIVSDGEDAIVLDPVSGEVIYRMPLGISSSPLSRIFAGQNIVSRINISQMREEAMRFSVSMTEKTYAGDRFLVLEVPPELIPQNGLDRITGSRAVFNLTNDTLMETEVIMVREDGTIVTTTATPVYREIEGIPVKIGMITVINSQAAGLIEGIDPNTPFFESIEDIPLLTGRELAEMKAAGSIYEIPGVIFGNPADLSFVETIFEVYNDIHINFTSEHLFLAILR